MRRWHGVARTDLSWKELDGELVVRNARTGSTHLLQPLAAEAFWLLLESDTLSADELARRLGDEVDSQEAETVLTEFERFGLAE